MLCAAKPFWNVSRSDILAICPVITKPIWQSQVLVAIPHLEPWYTWINSYMNSLKHMNSYMKKSYEFIYIWIHIIIIWIHIWNDYMNSYTCEFICEMNIWIHEYMNSCIWIQLYRFWIHTWFHKCMNMNSLMKINENAIFWIHDIEFSGERWHMNSL